jgi:hypothetical protein
VIIALERDSEISLIFELLPQKLQQKLFLLLRKNFAAHELSHFFFAHEAVPEKYFL